MVNIYLIAGGPGDPELITLKGQRLIDSADFIFTSYKFLPKEMFGNVKSECKIYDTFEHNYEEKMDIIKSAVNLNKKLVFVNMGDPCLYGMVGGIIDRLEKLDIEYEIVPGVSAFNAASSIIKRGMTGLGISNTAICTTYKDKDNSTEYLEEIASLKASVALFMSVDKIARVCKVFRKHYPDDTPVVVVSKATWKEQKIARGNLKNIENKLKKNNIEDGLILIGDFIDKEYDYELERKFMERKRMEANKK